MLVAIGGLLGFAINGAVASEMQVIGSTAEQVIVEDPETLKVYTRSTNDDGERMLSPPAESHHVRRLQTAVMYTNHVAFEMQLDTIATSDYTNSPYPEPFKILSNAEMNALAATLGGETYRTTGWDNHNLIAGSPSYTYFCAGCNGSYEISFTQTNIGSADGVHGVGIYILSHNGYTAYVTYSDGTSENVPIPNGGNQFWGITTGTSNKLIRSIHFGLPNGVSTRGGYFAINRLSFGTVDQGWLGWWRKQNKGISQYFNPHGWN